MNSSGCFREIFPLIALGFFVTPAVAADSPQVSTHVRQQSVQIAEPVDIVLTATAPAGWKIEPPPTPESWNDLRVIDSSERVEQKGRQFTWRRRLVLEGYAPGRQTIPPLTFRFEPPSPEADSAGLETTILETEPAVVHVRTALGLFDIGEGLRPINDRVFIPWTWREWVIAVVVAAVLLGGGILVVRWVRRWDEHTWRSSRSLAGELDRLREEWLRGQLDNSEAITAAAALFRQWLQQRSGEPEIHRTTEYWAEQPVEGPEACHAAALEVLRRADRIKFAGSGATPDEVRQSLEQVRQMVGSGRTKG